MCFEMIVDAEWWVGTFVLMVVLLLVMVVHSMMLFRWLEVVLVMEQDVVLAMELKMVLLMEQWFLFQTRSVPMLV